MRLTLAWLCVCLAIYCGGGFSSSNVVLSLPPSLIAATEAATAALRQQQSHWPKDARVLLDSGNVDALRDMLGHSKESAAAHKRSLNYNYAAADRVEAEQLPTMPTDFNRKALSSSSSSEAYDLELPQQQQQRQQSVPQEIAGGYAAAATPTPHKYWGKSRCHNGNCPWDYNRAMLAVRIKEAVTRLHKQLAAAQDRLDATNEDAEELFEADEEDLPLRHNNHEIFMLLTGEQDIVRFLHWAMKQMYSYKPSGFGLNPHSADFYHPGMFMWKKLNLSGHLEPPLIVDEPQYILVRREQQNRANIYQLGAESDPFIPPRGRKHNAPDLESLLQRYETFVPNRGKKDKVKDLFKYDDLFYPNRGKKQQRNLLQLDDPFYAHRGKKVKLSDLYNNDDPFFPNRGKRQQQSGFELYNDPGDNWPQRMSTHEINGNDQSVKSSMYMQQQQQQQLLRPANRLHSTRSMSANLQQQPLESQQQQQHWGLIVKPGMRRQQQQQQQQVKTSWPRSALHAPLETQLTRGQQQLRAEPDHDTDIDIDYGQLDI
ncbi:CG34388 [Drosophila busckii]|uniref:CG34388 n=1 Tax=Drosophila busckii TaxID=30019 RepID=A0A0M4EIP0_DROBS|nr:uncharacterized protein LOC108603215 [Drosophila busckii]ALC46596.1 CG34388 [Drosophila busckii]